MSLNVHQLIFGGIWGQLKQVVNTNDVLANQTWEALAFIEIYMAVCMTNRQKVKYQLFYWLYFGLLQLLKKMSCSLIAKCWLVAGLVCLFAAWKVTWLTRWTLDDCFRVFRHFPPFSYLRIAVFKIFTATNNTPKMMRYGYEWTHECEEINSFHGIKICLFIVFLING